ncbi:hypothetical protein BTVI_88884 [Pitangus sulphuratus]|nr:hypothetical protein BTVI_88884 [Pitangus sulphuratus]
MCKTLCLALLNFRKVAQSHLSSLPRSLWIHPFLLVLTTPHSLGLSSLKLAGGALIPLSMALAEMLNRASPNPTPEDTIPLWSALGYRAVDHNSGSVTILSIPYSLPGQSINSMSPQFRDKDVTWASVK